MPVAFVLLGALAGIGEAVLLWQAVRSAAQPFGMILRLLLVGSVLYAAAVAGYLLPSAAGWAAGFAACGTLVVWKTR